MDVLVCVGHQTRLLVNRVQIRDCSSLIRTGSLNLEMTSQSSLTSPSSDYYTDWDWIAIDYYTDWDWIEIDCVFRLGRLHSGASPFRTAPLTPLPYVDAPLTDWDC